MKKFKICANENNNSLAKVLEKAKKFKFVTIYLEEGIYNEKISINQNNITLIGLGNVVITHNDYSKKIHLDGRDYNTFRTATLEILANNITLKNIMIENTSLSKACGQAIALSVLGDRFKAINCYIKSEQDTLYLGPLPDDLKIRYTNFLKNEQVFINGNLISKFINCKIEGNIDYIFGTGVALFDNCDFISNGNGYVFAPAHSLFQQNGFYAIECNFIKKDDSIKDVYIARLWRPYGHLNIINCTFDEHINKKGYKEWNNLYPEVYNRIYEYPYLNTRIKYIHTYNNNEYHSLLDTIRKKLH